MNKYYLLIKMSKKYGINLFKLLLTMAPRVTGKISDRKTS